MNGLTDNANTLLRAKDIELEEIRKKHLEPQRPLELFHYTTFHGMEGIIDTKEIWATNFRYLNDTSEIIHANQILQKVVDDCISRNSSEVVKEFLLRAKCGVNPFELQMIDCYISCFCEENDSLNQWRDYGGSGGYCIGFDADSLGEKSHLDQSSPNTFLRKVIYDVDVQIELVSRVIDSAVEIILEAESVGKSQGYSTEKIEAIIPTCLGFIERNLAEYFCCFKNSQFKIEKEWRLLFFTSIGESHKIKYRDGAYGLTPYVSVNPMPWWVNSNGRLFIRSVKHGPTENPRLAIRTLTDYLYSKDCVNFQVFASELPIRHRKI